MGDLRPVVTEAEATTLLEDALGEPVQRPDAIEGGQVARTFAALVGEREYIVRFNQRMGANFEKEALACGWVAAHGGPLAPIVRIGRLRDLHVAVAPRMPGKPLDKLPPADQAALRPALLCTLDAIHAVDVGATTGYGVIGDDGAGLCPSWRRYLEMIREEEPEWEYFGKWHALFETTFLERDVFDRLYERMTRLAAFCPEDRYLVHGNYGFGNLLARDGAITAVLDWLDAAYGDFFFDVARLDFWHIEADFAEIVRDHHREQGVDVPNYHERLRCYQLYDGLNALRFFAKQGDFDAYRWTRDRLLALTK